MQLLLSQIVVPEDRQRKDLGDIDALAASFSNIGQIVPIVVELTSDEMYRLIAGERRLTAAKKLGWESIAVVLLRDLPEKTRQVIELEENIRRKQLEWQEEVQAVHKYWLLVKEPADIAAKALGIPTQTLNKMSAVAEGLEKFPELSVCASWTAAYAQYSIKIKRVTDAALEDFLSEGQGELLLTLAPMSNLTNAPESPLPPATSASVKAEVPAIAEISVPAIIAAPAFAAPAPAEAPAFSAELADFATYIKTYNGKRFNLIHCDFPYGLNMGVEKLQNSSARWDTTDGRYEDSPELFDRLCRAFFDYQDSFAAASAHCIFWLASKNYGRTASRFTHYGWSVFEMPLIWHKSDNAGIAPDVRRWPRRTYEMAVFASRGDRKILKVKAASYAGPTTKEHHLSEKPEAMLTHFFEMLIDDTTEIFDPTAGSGTALRVAKALGASRGLGLDTSQTHVEFINKKLRG